MFCKELKGVDITALENAINHLVQKYVTQTKTNILNTLFMRLYDWNHMEEMKRDLCKCVVMKADYEPKSEERIKLLMALFWALQYLFQDDYHTLFDAVEDIIENNKTMEDWDDNLPFP